MQLLANKSYLSASGVVNLFVVLVSYDGILVLK